MPAANTLATAEVTYGESALLQPDSTDRRSRVRFPIVLAFSYRTLDRKSHSGVGRILNISSTGALAECRDPFTAGTTVELTMEWPARLHGWIPLQLIMVGSIVRCEVSRFAVAARQLRLGPERPTFARDFPVSISERQVEEPEFSIAASNAHHVHAVPGVLSASELLLQNDCQLPYER